MKKFEELKYKSKEFFNRNERRIKVGVNVGVGIILGVSIMKNMQNKVVINNLKVKNGEQKSIINKLVDTVLDYKDLCERKDAAHCKTIAIAMREGSKEAAKEMAYRKQYLNKLKQIA